MSSHYNNLIKCLSPAQKSKAYFLLRRQIESTGITIYDSLTDGLAYDGEMGPVIILVPQEIGKMVHVLAHEIGHLCKVETKRAGKGTYWALRKRGIKSGIAP